MKGLDISHKLPKMINGKWPNLESDKSGKWLKLPKIWFYPLFFTGSQMEEYLSKIWSQTDLSLSPCLLCFPSSITFSKPLLFSHKSCLTLLPSMECAASRVLCPWHFEGKNTREWFTCFHFSRSSVWLRDWICVSYILAQFITIEPPGKTLTSLPTS